VPKAGLAAESSTNTTILEEIELILYSFNLVHPPYSIVFLFYSLLSH
jgi:hypothetical protein